MERQTKFPLVDGKCPVCETQIEHVIDGVRVSLIIHDADFCRATAQYNAKALRRALEEAYEARAFARYREAFYRHAFAAALHELAANAGRHPDDWRDRIEQKVRDEMERAKERAEIAAVRELAEAAKPLP